jgi:putative transposase
LQKLWAGSTYEKGDLVDQVRDKLNIVLDIVKRSQDQVGFQVLPRRWVAERTFACLGRYRRLSKDYGHCTKSSEGIVCITSIHTMLKRLASHA